MFIAMKTKVSRILLRFGKLLNFESFGKKPDKAGSKHSYAALYPRRYKSFKVTISLK
jgi:hypothetical protein